MYLIIILLYFFLCALGNHRSYRYLKEMKKYANILTMFLPKYISIIKYLSKSL